MTFANVPRNIHLQRAERHVARFSPTWTGETTPTTAPLPVSPASDTPPPKHEHQDPGALAPPPPPPSSSPSPLQSDPPVPIDSVMTLSAVTAVTPTTTPTRSSLSSLIPTTTTPSSTVLPTIIATTPSSPFVITPTTFRSLPIASFVTVTTSSSASPSPTVVASSSIGTGAIIGIAAGGIVGAVLLGVVGVWVLKRWFQDRDSDEDNSPGAFNRHTWMRNSVALHDEVPASIVRGGPSETPRPPTMIERKRTLNYSNLASPHAQPGQGIEYADYRGQPYGPPPMPPPVPGFGSGQRFVGSYPNSPTGYFSPIAPASTSSPGMTAPDETMPPMQHAQVTPVYFSRHDSNLSNMSTLQPDSTPFIDTPNSHEANDGGGYATLDRTSVTPYQAEQYAAISRQLDAVSLAPAAEGSDALSHHASAMEEHTPTASPFADSAAVSYQEVTFPPRIDSTPAALPPIRAMSPFGGPGQHASFRQLANAFPPAPTSPVPATSSPKSLAFPPPSPRAIALPPSPSSSVFSSTHAATNAAPSLSSGIGPKKGQVMTVPDVHASNETPVQFGVPALDHTPTGSAPAPARPATLYDEEDAYGGI